MFGISYIKFDSMTYVIHFKNGQVAKEGRGLSFFYFSPNSSISAIPLGSNDLPFIFNETTHDYQNISIQGQVTYKISNPKQLAELLKEKNEFLTRCPGWIVVNQPDCFNVKEENAPEG